ATQTGPETGTLRRCRIRIKAHILTIRRPRCAYRPAIDMRRGDPDKKPAVKPAIAGPYRAKTSISVEFHGARLAPVGRQYSPFSDVDMPIAGVQTDRDWPQTQTQASCVSRSGIASDLQDR
ncbi:MAG TPA: hypothetical protein VNH39_14045, partial [Steroidobacteraceae bacterium]|nr:hypothetical protein [Steroidobacteraceae bacterium]